MRTPPAGSGKGAGRQRRSARERRELIEAYNGSGQKASAFCRERGIHPATFYRWRKEPSLPVGGWTEVQVQRIAPTVQAVSLSSPLEIELRSGVRFSVRDAGWLPEVAAFVRALEERSC